MNPQIRFSTFIVHNSQVTNFTRLIVLNIKSIALRVYSYNCFFNVNSPLINAIPYMRYTPMRAINLGGGYTSYSKICHTFFRYKSNGK